MTSPLRHALDLVSYAATRRSHDRHDASTVADLMVEPSDLGLPPGLEVRWLGVAGFALSYRGTTVLIDPFVSRVPSAVVTSKRTNRGVTLACQTRAGTLCAPSTVSMRAACSSYLFVIAAPCAVRHATRKRVGRRPER